MFRTAMLAAAAIGVALSSPAHAQGMGGGMGGGMGCGMGGGMGGGMGMGRGMGRGMALITKLCADDIATRCANVGRGPDLRACLEKESKDLSENCRTAVETTGRGHRPGQGPVASLCMAEIDKFCAEIEHVNGQVRTCLEKHKSELGETCSVALDATGCRWKR
jgi:hypothetical protein